VSPIRPWLYRRACRAVIWAVLVACGAPIAYSQLARKTKEAKGPRALGLVELSSNGKARLIPIAIMVDGKFYDAGAYKASPVPFALWSETVYEGEKTGVSQGLFTVHEAMRTGSDIWFGEGKWTPAGSEKPRRKDTKPKLEEDEGPPKLRRAQSDTEKSPPTSSPTSTQPAETKSPSATAAPPPATTAPSGSPSSTSASPSENEKPSDQSPSTTSNDYDPNRPVLKRGQTETLGAAHPAPPVLQANAAPAKGTPAKSNDQKSGPQLIPAISDAGGPDPRPYSYDLRSDEEQKYRKAMIALATEAVLARVKETTPILPESKPAARPSSQHRAAKAPQPSFDDIRFRAFDLWNTNEPVFILSARAQMPKTSAASGSGDLPYFVTLVAKKDIYDDLHKLYAGVTDTRHLDETPRLELIDAVDADGDGRGELLFRRVSDTGSTWGVYRAGADQMFPLFEGAPAGQ